MPAPRPRRISDFLPKLQNVAQTSNFFVKFALPSGSLRRYMRQRGINDRFVAEDIGLLCHDAVLPGSAMATMNTAGDYQGLIERFAHTRNYTEISLEFYVDNEYKSLKFLEHWMEFITGASPSDPSSDSYHYKLEYPETYKSNDTRIIKFEKNHFQFLEYRFVGLFPMSLSSTKVGYTNSQVLKATATFSFDRYICGESSSLARDLGISFNKKGPVSDFTTRRQTGYDLQTTLSNVYRESAFNVLNSGPYRKVSGKVNSTPVTNAAGQSLGSGTNIS